MNYDGGRVGGGGGGQWWCLYTNYYFMYIYIYKNVCMSSLIESLIVAQCQCHRTPFLD